MITVSIIGLGYVGLPLACLCIEKGLLVKGVDIDVHKLDLLRKGECPLDDERLAKEVKKHYKKFLLTDNTAEAVSKSDVIIVCVPTPVDSKHNPDLKPLIGACEAIALGIRENCVVVIESTIYPGTVEEIVLPILQKSGKHFFLGHCPERIDPGNRKYTVKNLPRVVGGIDDASTKEIAKFYRSIIEAETVELSSVKAAEATKIMENTFRDVNIAFVNEMAKSFDMVGIDITEVIKGASSKPFGFMPHYPGAGVGGHCIAVDPYYLIAKAKQSGFDHDFLILARKINESMPLYTIDILENLLKQLKKGIKGTKVGVLGLAYKGNVDDTRESPSWEVLSLLKKKESIIEIYDPFVKESSTVKNIDEFFSKVEAVVLVTDHTEFKSMDYGLIKRNNVRVIVDGRNCLDKEKIKSAGALYHGIGR